MRIAFFSTKSYDRLHFVPEAKARGHEILFLEPRLSEETAPLAAGFPCISAFVNDRLDAGVLEILARGGTKVVALRSAGYNHVDLKAGRRLAISVVRVPAYSPHAVAEHTVGLILALNRKIHRATTRVREGNFSLEGLLGFDLAGKTAGIVGTGRIGRIVAKILAGFDCHLLAFDPYPSAECEALGARYLPLDDLLAESDIVTLHCPLTPGSHHLIGPEAVRRMKRGAMLVNTSRGALVDTRAVIFGLKTGQLGSLGLDVYEEEGDLFFEDLSNRVIQDDVFTRLLTFPNVVITGHQAFFTEEALSAIAATTLANVSDIEAGRKCPNEIE